MSPLVRELLVNGLMAGTAVRTAKKTSAGIACYAAAGGIAFLALVFFSVAGYGMLLAWFTMPAAAAITGAAILSVAAAVAGAGYYRLHKKPLRKASADGSLIDTIEGTAKTLLAGLEEPVRDNPKMAMLLAALAGFAAADQIGEKIH